MTSTIPTTELGTARWTIDPAHSEVGFTVRHLMSKVRGQFATFTGTIDTDGSPVASAVSVTIESGSVTTNNAQRDAHLRSADFFDPAKGGELHFASTQIREAEDGYVITGELTINGVTRTVDLAAEFLGVDVDAYGADPARRRGQHLDRPPRLRGHLQHPAGRRQGPHRQQGRHHLGDRSRPRLTPVRRSGPRERPLGGPLGARLVRVPTRG